jgi:hypothetical protein
MVRRVEARGCVHPLHREGMNRLCLAHHPTTTTTAPEKEIEQS